jgi:ribosomal protein S18 acetylase RimI-like enzyme
VTKIKRLERTDHESWLPLWRGYQAFYRVDLGQAQDDLTWQRLMAENEPMWVLGAFEAERLVGIVHYVFHRSCWTAGDYVYLQDLFVDPALRARGIGRALIAAVVARARESGAARVHWLTHESNADAQVLYDRVAERSGFIQYRIRV